MDQLTHTVRRSNWIKIIRQCQDRPAGTTAKQWLAENDISEKSYYYLPDSMLNSAGIPCLPLCCA